MIFVKQRPWLIPPRASVVPQADNLRPTLTTQQISQIARIFDSTVEQDELRKARTAWTQYQSTRKRDAVYGYLSVIFEIVVRWKEQRRAKACSHQALIATKNSGAIKIDEPFAVVIFCTSDSRKLDTKTRSKWSRLLDMPSDLSQMLRGSPSSSKAGAASTNVLASGLIALGTLAVDVQVNCKRT